MTKTVMEICQPPMTRVKNEDGVVSTDIGIAEADAEAAGDVSDSDAAPTKWTGSRRRSKHKTRVSSAPRPDRKGVGTRAAQSQSSSRKRQRYARKVGPKGSSEQVTTPAEAFNSFLPDAILDKIIKHRNDGKD